jgi:hypothetical protein
MDLTDEEKQAILNKQTLKILGQDKRKAISKILATPEFAEKSDGDKLKELVELKRQKKVDLKAKAKAITLDETGKMIQSGIEELFKAIDEEFKPEPLVKHTSPKREEKAKESVEKEESEARAQIKTEEILSDPVVGEETAREVAQESITEEQHTGTALPFVETVMNTTTAEVTNLKTLAESAGLLSSSKGRMDHPHKIGNFSQTYGVGQSFNRLMTQAYNDKIGRFARFSFEG